MIPARSILHNGGVTNPVAPRRRLDIGHQPAGRRPKVSTAAPLRRPLFRDRGPVGAALLLVGATVAGCRGCQEERPYTPFTVAESAALPAGSGGPPLPSAAGSAVAAFVPTPAVRAEPAARDLEVGDRRVTAPADHVLESALAADFDGDGAAEIVAWARGTRERGGALWLYPANAAPRALWRLPDFLPTSDDCTLTTTLARTGPQTVTLDAGVACATARIARAPSRTLAVLAPFGGRVEKLALRLAAPAPGETLVASVRTTDRDGDGQDDVTVELALTAGGATAPATAELTWIDRAAGPSRDPGEPLASLSRAARNALDRGAKRAHCAESLERVELVRRLTATLCAEAGTPRVFDREGTPVRCGERGPLVDTLADAEVTASLTCDDVVRATSVLSRDGWFLAPLSAPRRASLTKRIANATVAITPSLTRSLVARVAAATGPRWSPLRFEQPEASLLVMTPAGLLRASPDGSQEQPAEPSTGAVPWSLAVRSAGGRLWTSVSQACDRSELLLGLDDGAMKLLPSPVLAARPGACQGGAVPKVPAPVALGFTNGGEQLAAIVAGVRIGEKTAHADPGSARSPDGARVAVATGLGVLVIGGERPELWGGPDLSDPVGLSDCVTANGGAAIACVRHDRVILARR